MSPNRAHFIDRLVAELNVRLVTNRTHARTDPHRLRREVAVWKNLPADQLLPGPQAPAEVRMHPIAPLPWADRWDLQFDSLRPIGIAVNDRVHARLLLPKGSHEPLSAAGIGPVMLILPGWLSRTYAESETLVARYVLNQGCGAMILQLPFHMRRRLPGQGNGQWTITGDLIRTAAAIRQSVADAGSCVQWLRDRGSGRVGVFGLSLGAWVGSLLGCRTDEFDLLVGVAPPVRLDRMFRTSPLTRGIYRDVRAGGVDDDLLDDALRTMSVLHFEPRLPRDRVMLVEPMYDLLVDNGGVRDLADHWGGAKLISLPEGHVTVRFSQAFRDLLAECSSVRLMGRSPKPAPAPDAEPLAEAQAFAAAV